MIAQTREVNAARSVGSVLALLVVFASQPAIAFRNTSTWAGELGTPSTLDWTWCFQSQTVCLNVASTPTGSLDATVGKDLAVTVHPIDMTSSSDLAPLSAQNQDQTDGIITVLGASIHYSAPPLQPLAEIGYLDFEGTTLTVDGGTVVFDVIGVGSGVHDFGLDPVEMTVSSLTYGTWDAAARRLTANLIAMSGVVDIGGFDVELEMILEIDEVLVPTSGVPALSPGGVLVALFALGVAGLLAIARVREPRRRPVGNNHELN